jgi:hypothetical protein
MEEPSSSEEGALHSYIDRLAHILPTLQYPEDGRDIFFRSLVSNCQNF